MPKVAKNKKSKRASSKPAEVDLKKRLIEARRVAIKKREDELVKIAQERDEKLKQREMNLTNAVKQQLEVLMSSGKMSTDFVPICEQTTKDEINEIINKLLDDDDSRPIVTASIRFFKYLCTDQELKLSFDN